MQNNNNGRMKKGILLQCACFMVFFGTFFTLVGVILTGVGNANESEFFWEAHRPMRIVGPVLLSLGLVGVITGAITIYCIKKEMKEAFSRDQHTTGVSGPMISGSAPYNTYVGAQGPGAQPVVHPTTNVGYTPQYGGVANAQPVYPAGQNMPPTSQPPYPAGVNTGYPATGPPSAPSAPYPAQSLPPHHPKSQTTDPMQQPPPAYDEVMEKR